METTRILVSETSREHGAAYRQWATVLPAVAPKGTVVLQFSSTLEGTRNPNQHHVQHKLTLQSKEEVRNLIALLQKFA